MKNPVLLELISKQMTDAIGKQEELKHTVYKCSDVLRDILEIGDEILVYTDGSRILPGRVSTIWTAWNNFQVRLLIDGVWTEEEYKLDYSRIRGNYIK